MVSIHPGKFPGGDHGWGRYCHVQYRFHAAGPDLAVPGAGHHGGRDGSTGGRILRLAG